MNLKLNMRGSRLVACSVVRGRLRMNISASLPLGWASSAASLLSSRARAVRNRTCSLIIRR